MLINAEVMVTTHLDAQRIEVGISRFNHRRLHAIQEADAHGGQRGRVSQQVPSAGALSTAEGRVRQVGRTNDAELACVRVVARDWRVRSGGCLNHRAVHDVAGSHVEGIRDQQNLRHDAERLAVRISLIEECRFSSGQTTDGEGIARLKVVATCGEERGVVEERSPEHLVDLRAAPRPRRLGTSVNAPRSSLI